MYYYTPSRSICQPLFSIFSKKFFDRKTAKFRYFFYFSVTFSKKLQKIFFALHQKNQQETLETIPTLQKSSGKIYRKLTT
ncbi:MAG: hypothetical protein UD299_00785 [Ruminococcus sp.]|nr:hypothetical protein [Ruminococcus sp.]